VSVAALPGNSLANRTMRENKSGQVSDVDTWPCNPVGCRGNRMVQVRLPWAQLSTEPNHRRGTGSKLTTR
jgi:hypothetical protein